MNIREANRSDIKEIFTQIMDLSKFQGIASLVVITEEILEKLLFEATGGPKALIAEIDGSPIGFCMYNFIKADMVYNLEPNALYIDKLYVKPEYRNKKIGYKLFKKLVEIAKSTKCAHIEWWVTNDNKVGIDFYKKLGGEILESVSICRLSGKNLKDF